MVYYDYFSEISSLLKVVNKNNSYIVKSQDISCVEYYKNKHEVVITGKIKFVTAVQDEKLEEVDIDTIDFLNIFNKDFIEWSKQNNINVKEI